VFEGVDKRKAFKKKLCGFFNLSLTLPAGSVTIQSKTDDSVDSNGFVVTWTASKYTMLNCV